MSLSPPRPAAVAAVLAGARRWHRGRRKLDGRVFFLIPGSRPGVVYYTDPTACTCPDANERQRVCKHALAVQQYQARQQPAPATTPKPRSTYADLFPACAGCGDVVERKGDECFSCQLVAEARERQSLAASRERIATL